ncbi:helix-turn-helix domain-containing protein [[Clostridium] colinum]|nr:helix-turn-helix transcriptional regulator [[Clostridium] colinum]
MSLAKNLKSYRIELGLTQKKLAEQVNLGETMISEVECGRKQLSILSLKK